MGNGRLGAMLFGGVDEERLVLNETSMWSGSPQDADRPEGREVLRQVQRLLLAGKNAEAETLVNEKFTCRGAGSAGGQYGCYQTLGNLHLLFASENRDAVENYRRELRLEDAITRMQFSRGGVTFYREMFVSTPAQVIVLRLWADRKGQLSFTTHLDRPERFTTVAAASNELLMTGQLDNGVDGNGVRYAARLRIMHKGGSVEKRGNTLIVTKANEVILRLGAATDYHGLAGRQTRNPAAASLDDLNRAAVVSYTSLRTTHINDYHKFFRRVSLDLGIPCTADAALPTPQRIVAAYQHGGEPDLAALYFNFGRYLLISSSRPGGFPANLQGLWAEEIHTPWTGDWHLDMNVEMNYWPAEACNLSELNQPLFALIASLQKPGSRTARIQYGANGWVAHVITNPWGFTSPGEEASWGAATCGSAWLCQHLYDHYLFTRDRKFLQWAYPIMKGAAEFYSDLLIEEPAHHWLVVAPANSPENHFLTASGQLASICMGPTMLQQLVRYLFKACIDSSRVLGVDAEFRRVLLSNQARLAPNQIASDGRLMEWLEDYEQPEPHHRHISHLWGLYPGDEILPGTTPEFARAARKTLDARGDDGVGWSLANKALLWARLGDGDRSWVLIRKALAPAAGMDIRYDAGGGVYPNLFDACPPFQIDGNFGITAAVAEMLLQSQDGAIHLLPALPQAWKDGAVTGLRARGGFEAGVTWKDGRLTTAIIHSDYSSLCRVQYAGRETTLNFKKGTSIALDANLSRVDSGFSKLPARLEGAASR